MNIAIFCCPPVGKPGHNVGGVHAVVSHILRELTARGDDVTLITGTFFGEVPAGEDPYACLCKKLEGKHFDRVHIVTNTTLGLLARRWCIENGVAHTQTYDTQIPEYLHVRYQLPLDAAYSYVRWFCDSAATIIVPTPSMKRLLESNGVKHVVVNEWGVDTELFHPVCEGGWHNPETEKFFNTLKAKGDPVLLYVGRITPEKNVLDFLNLKFDGEAHTKVLVGGVSGGYDEEELKKQYPDAIFVGVKTGEDLADYYRGADVFVFPSKTDTFGLVLLEAIASGTPVAAYPVIGTMDVVTSDKVGCLDNNLEVAVANALYKSRIDCREYALKRSWEQSIAKFASHFTPTDSGISQFEPGEESKVWGDMSYDALTALVKKTHATLFLDEPSGPYAKTRVSKVA